MGSPHHHPRPGRVHPRYTPGHRLVLALALVVLAAALVLMVTAPLADGTHRPPTSTQGPP